jgi:hypothetical protein
VASDTGGSVRPRRYGPHYVPHINCGRCGETHHIDAAAGEYQGTCSECSAFLRRPTQAEERQFYDFLDWGERHRQADRNGSQAGDGE